MFSQRIQQGSSVDILVLQVEVSISLDVLLCFGRLSEYPNASLEDVAKGVGWVLGNGMFVHSTFLHSVHITGSFHVRAVEKTLLDEV